jgi:hypothetical protein
MYVPRGVQRFETVHGLHQADLYLPSASNPGVYLDSLEAMFPEPREPTGESTEAGRAARSRGWLDSLEEVLPESGEPDEESAGQTGEAPEQADHQAHQSPQGRKD